LHELSPRKHEYSIYRFICKPYAVGVGAGRTSGFFACGSMEEAIFFVRFGDFAAKTNERNVNFRAAAGEKAVAA
jgi:hypothetical protein